MHYVREDTPESPNDTNSVITQSMHRYRMITSIDRRFDITENYTGSLLRHFAYTVFHSATPKLTVK